MYSGTSSIFGLIIFYLLHFRRKQGTSCTSNQQKQSSTNQFAKLFLIFPLCT